MLVGIPFAFVWGLGSAVGVLALTDADIIDRLSEPGRPFRLFLDVNDDAPEPLWLRNTRPARSASSG